jgi:excisionase family DNA binding protein
MSLPALYTPEEAAAKLKVTRRAVYKWLMSGRLNGLRVGQHWRITEDELINFMQQGGHEAKVADQGQNADAQLD